VVLDVRRGGTGIEELRQVRRSADRVEVAGGLQVFREGDGVDHLALLPEPDHRPVEAPVPLAVEHRVVDDLDRLRDRVGSMNIPPSTDISASSE
jgi:hypothetical protein